MVAEEVPEWPLALVVDGLVVGVLAAVVDLAAGSFPAPFPSHPQRAGIVDRDFDVGFNCRGRRSIHRFGGDSSCNGFRRLGRTTRSVARRSPRTSCWCRFGHRPHF